MNSRYLILKMFLFNGVALLLLSAVGPKWASELSDTKPVPPEEEYKQIWGVLPENCHALLVGLDFYTSYSQLQYCVSDVEAFEKQLKVMGVPVNNIRKLIRTASDNDNQPVTKSIIINKLNEFFSKGSKDKDLYLLSLSGHGVWVKLAANSDKKIQCFCPSDANLQKPETLLPIDEIDDIIKKSGAKKVLVFIDACRTDSNAVYRNGNDNSVHSDNGSDDAPQTDHDYQGKIIYFKSCDTGQSSYEDASLKLENGTTGSKGGHGVFLYHVLESLNGKILFKNNDPGKKNLGRWKDWWELKWTAFRDNVVHKTLGHVDSLNQGKIQCPRTVGDDDLDFTFLWYHEKIDPNPALIETDLQNIDDLLKNYASTFVMIPRGSVIIPNPPNGKVCKGANCIKIDTHFYIASREVPQKIYTAIMKNNSSDNRGDDSLPVENMTREKAFEFVDQLNKNYPPKIGNDDSWEYAIPSPQEWEYAFYSQQDLDQKPPREWFNYLLENIDNYAWYGENASKSTHSVGEKKPIGKLYDMLGNVAEWCSLDNSPELYNIKGGSWKDYPSFKMSTGLNPAWRKGVLKKASPEIGIRLIIRKKRSEPDETKSL